MSPAADVEVVSPEVSLEDIVPELDQLQEELAETVRQGWLFLMQGCTLSVLFSVI